MRKNIKAVIAAFINGESLDKGTCSTDGKTIWSYQMEIAHKMSDGAVVVLPRERGPSVTTRSQIDAVKSTFPNMAIHCPVVSEVTVVVDPALMRAAEANEKRLAAKKSTRKAVSK
jgi:hypothetical protein